MGQNSLGSVLWGHRFFQPFPGLSPYSASTQKPLWCSELPTTTELTVCPILPTPPILLPSLVLQDGRVLSEKQNKNKKNTLSKESISYSRESSKFYILGKSILSSDDPSLVPFTVCGKQLPGQGCISRPCQESASWDTRWKHTVNEQSPPTAEWFQGLWLYFQPEERQLSFFGKREETEAQVHLDRCMLIPTP